MKSLITILLFVAPAFCWAGQAGHDQGGGGDVQCDAKLKSISGNLLSWIQGGGPEVGKLNLSSSIFPGATPRAYVLADYDKAMSDLLKLPLDSSCVSQGDRGYPVQAGDDSKVCFTSVSGGQVHMKCDQVKFLGMDPDLQIEQVHHEYAINVRGLEPDYGPISTYKISTQLSAYTKDVTERRLVVMAPSIPAAPSPGIDVALQSALTTCMVTGDSAKGFESLLSRLYSRVYSSSPNLAHAGIKITRTYGQGPTQERIEDATDDFNPGSSLSYNPETTIYALRPEVWVSSSANPPDFTQPPRPGGMLMLEQDGSPLGDPSPLDVSGNASGNDFRFSASFIASSNEFVSLGTPVNIPTIIFQVGPTYDQWQNVSGYQVENVKLSDPSQASLDFLNSYTQKPVFSLDFSEYTKCLKAEIGLE